MTTRIYLLRHGSTALNRCVPYKLQGRRVDPPLDEVGRDQARRAAGALASSGLAAVYGSPLLRSLETARIVAGPHGLDADVAEGMIEAEIGRWEGLTWDEARAQDPEWYERFHERPGTTPYPGGESFEQAGSRAATALRDLARRHPGRRIAVVGHNVVNRALLAGPLGLSIERARSIRQDNGGINVLEHDGETVAIVGLNGCLHLDAG